MYKIIHNNIIIDVVEELRYVRYIPQFNKIVPTNALTAQGICGSKNGVYYALQGINIPAEKKHWKQVSIFEISETEFNDLRSRLNKNYTLYANNVILDSTRKDKIAELSIECNKIITEGISVRLEDNFYYNFRLTIEDQINILELEKEVRDGATSVIYHSTNNVCREYTANEIKLISNAASNHKKYHTTYFNLLKYCINNMYNTDEINNIKYGDKLTELDVNDEIKKLVKEKINE